VLFRKLPAVASTPASARENAGIISPGELVKLTVNPPGSIDTQDARNTMLSPESKTRMHASVCCPRCVSLVPTPSTLKNSLAHWFPPASIAPRPNAALEVVIGSDPNNPPAWAWTTTSG
jgi:hypothetical protein